MSELKWGMWDHMGVAWSVGRIGGHSHRIMTLPPPQADVHVRRTRQGAGAQRKGAKRGGHRKNFPIFS
jgi:hypothetical protein